MIHLLTDLPPGVIGFEVSGEVSTADYREILIPVIDAAIAEHGGLRAVCVVGDDLRLTPGAVWEDLRTGLQDWNAWQRLALVTDHVWVRDATRLFAWLIPGQVKTFSMAERADASTWVAGSD